MINLIDFIKKNKFNLRNIEISEELEKINNTYHSKQRSLGRNDINKAENNLLNLGNIKESEIKEIFASINDIIENDCLNGKIVLNKSEIGVSFDIFPEQIILIFWVTNFDKITFKYDIKLKTCNRYKSNYKFVFTDVLYHIRVKNKFKKVYESL